MDTITANQVAEHIAAITYAEPGSLNPLHEVVDRDKFNHLVTDMADNDWVGAPLVVDGENAFTGAHRIAAAAKLWNEHGTAIEIPRVEISELCEMYGLDWADMVAEHDGDTYEAAAALRSELPREVVDYLGFDVDGAL